MNFFLLIILLFMSQKKSIVSLCEPEKADFLDIFILICIHISCLADLSMKNVQNENGTVASLKEHFPCKVPRSRTLLSPRLYFNMALVLALYDCLL